MRQPVKRQKTAQPDISGPKNWACISLEKLLKAVYIRENNDG
jgi:hypothetical protein